MAISDVQLRNNYYQVFDSNGKKTKENHILHMLVILETLQVLQ